MIHSRAFYAMGAHMLAAIDTPGTEIPAILDEAPAWFEEWEAALSRFRPESELSRLNRQTGSFVRVSDTLWAVYRAAVEAEKRSQGLVTPTVYASMEKIGYTHSLTGQQPPFFTPIPDPEASWIPAPIPSLAAITADPQSQALRIPSHARLDFGGIAKGWAAHQALERLQAFGPALVDAGGDLAVGKPPLKSGAWPVGIEDAFQPGHIRENLQLAGCGVATSGRDYRRWQQGDVWRHHLIDPRTGLPADTDILTATVIAPTAMEAEMAAKTVLILGSQAGLSWLEGQPGYAGLLLLENGGTLESQRFEMYRWGGE